MRRAVLRGRGGWQAQLLFGLSLLCLCAGLFTLGWAIWPIARDAVQMEIPAGPLPAAPEGTGYASLAKYALSVAWPVRIRKGETSTIQVFLADVSREKSEGEAQEVQIVRVEPIVPGLSVEPKYLQYSVGAGQDLTLSWAVNGIVEGDYPGKVVVSFGFYDESLAEIVPAPVAVVDVNVRVTALWGLAPGMAVWLGFVGLALWGALFLLGRVVQARGRDRGKRGHDVTG